MMQRSPWFSEFWSLRKKETTTILQEALAFFKEVNDF